MYENHVDFCASQFDAQPILSKENFDELEIGTWDLIFCGSLLTHLPVELFQAVIRFMARSLSDTGIAVITTEGRHSIHIQKNKWKLIDDHLFDEAERDFRSNGFGFVDYNADFRAGSFGKQASYGVTLASASWIMNELTKMDGIRIYSFTERAWDDHQDVIVFGRPGIDE